MNNVYGMNSCAFNLLPNVVMFNGQNYPNLVPTGEYNIARDQAGGFF